MNLVTLFKKKQYDDNVTKSVKTKGSVLNHRKIAVAPNF